MARLGSMGCRPLSWGPIGFLSSPHCGELRKPIGSHETCRNHSTPRCASSPSLRGRLCREQRETRARTRVVTRSLSAKNPGPVLRGTLPHAIRANFRPLIPSLSFAHALTKVLPAQVARSARRRSTSRLHERARHVWRRGIVKRLLRYRLEGHFRSQSFISRILIDATP